MRVAPSDARRRMEIEGRARAGVCSRLGGGGWARRLKRLLWSGYRNTFNFDCCVQLRRFSRKKEGGGGKPRVSISTKKKEKIKIFFPLSFPTHKSRHTETAPRGLHALTRENDRAHVDVHASVPHAVRAGGAAGVGATAEVYR